MTTAFETFVNDELPNRIATQEGSNTSGYYPRYSGTAKLTTERSPAQVLGDIGGAAAAVNLTAGVGLTGGGDLSASRTFDFDVNDLAIKSGAMAAADWIPVYDADGVGVKTTKISFADFESGLSITESQISDLSHFTPSTIDADYGAETVTSLLTFSRNPSAPFAVSAGSGVVANLDADLLDGSHASAFATSGHTHAIGDLTDVTTTAPNADAFLTWDAGSSQWIDKDFTDLLALEALAGTGYAVRTAADAWSQRSFAGDANEITITNGDGVAGNTSIGLADDVIMPGSGAVTVPAGTTAQVPGSPANGMIRYDATTNKFRAYENSAWVDMIGGAGAIALDDLTDVTVPTPSNNEFLMYYSAGSVWQANSLPDLIAIELLNTNGMLTRTANNTWISRTITGTASEIDVSNGDGIAGNPVIGVSDDAVLPGTGAVTVPAGTTAQAPGLPANGMIRYDATTNKFRAYENSAWVDMIGGAGAIALDDLTDVVITAAAAGDFLQYDGSNWVDAPLRIRDQTTPSNWLNVRWAENATGDSNLDLVIGSGLTRTLTMNGDAALNQSLQTTDLVTFAKITVDNVAIDASAITGTSGLTVTTTANGNLTLQADGTGTSYLGQGSADIELGNSAGQSVNPYADDQIHLGAETLRYKSIFTLKADIEGILAFGPGGDNLLKPTTSTLTIGDGCFFMLDDVDLAGSNQFIDAINGTEVDGRIIVIGSKVSGSFHYNMRSKVSNIDLVGGTMLFDDSNSRDFIVLMWNATAKKFIDSTAGVWLEIARSEWP